MCLKWRQRYPQSQSMLQTVEMALFELPVRKRRKAWIRQPTTGIVGASLNCASEPYSVLVQASVRPNGNGSFNASSE